MPAVYRGFPLGTSCSANSQVERYENADALVFFFFIALVYNGSSLLIRGNCAARVHQWKKSQKRRRIMLCTLSRISKIAFCLLGQIRGGTGWDARCAIIITENCELVNYEGNLNAVIFRSLYNIHMWLSASSTFLPPGSLFYPCVHSFLCQCWIPVSRAPDISFLMRALFFNIPLLSLCCFTKFGR